MALALQYTQIRTKISVVINKPMKSQWKVNEIVNEKLMKTQWKLNENSMKTQWKLNEIFWLILIEFNLFWLVCAFAALFRQMQTPWKLHENSMKTPWKLHEHNSMAQKAKKIQDFFCFFTSENSMKTQWKFNENSKVHTIS